MPQTPRGQWGQNHISILLGVAEASWSKVLSGLQYPARLQTMQRIEVVFGWPVSEQVQLIPMYWEWPEQASSGRPPGEPTDLRYAMMLRKVIAEWCEANPRTVATKNLTLHPSLKPYNRVEGPRYTATQGQDRKVQAEETFTAAKSPLLKR